MYRVDIRSYDDPRQWVPIGSELADSRFPSEAEAARWIEGNIAYRVGEGATRDDYRIVHHTPPPTSPQAQ